MNFGKLVWEKRTREEIEHFASAYKNFISKSLTERLAVRLLAEILEAHGFKHVDALSRYEESGVFLIHRSKALVAVKGDLRNGLNLLAAHVDAPRLDLRPYPLYEDTGYALAETHYYGGVKKYQWFNIPLALVGTVVRDDGTSVEVCVGCDEGDPVFVVPDLPPHLDKEDGKVSEQFKAERMNVLLGSIPQSGEKEDPVKKSVLSILGEKYGITEEDLVSSDLELVPIVKPRDVGFDGSFIGAYGHDDRVCAYLAIRSLVDAQLSSSSRAAAVVLFDREEIGSEGDASAQARFHLWFFKHLLKLMSGDGEVPEIDELIAKSCAISADVTALYDPSFPNVHDKLNVAKPGYGVAIVKYTGRGGKYAASEAHAELVAKVRKIFKERGISWQTSLLGKVDVGGGGTVAKFLAKEGFNTVDMGPGLMSMHSPFELISKADLYETYLAFKVLLEELA